MLTDREIYFWIAQTDGWTFRRMQTIMEKYPTVGEIYERFESDADFFLRVLTKEPYWTARNTRGEKEIRKKIAALEEQKLRFLTPADEDFPKGVAELQYDRPPVLYYAGDSALFRNRGISVVGTRRNTYYGAKITESLIGGLKGSGLTVVSGLADGIDTVAHEAALNCGMNTIAVLGSGISRITPAGNVGLARRIVRAGGLVVSEFPPDFAGSRYSYPQRNRLIAALGDGVVLVEAGEKSGALYTVDHAIDQGKDVFLVPSNLDSARFVGVLRAYREGKGEFVYGAEDILETLGYSLTAGVEEERRESSLDPDSRKILDSLEDVALNYDRLFERSALSPSQFAVVLTNLELEGLIESRGGLYYKK